MRKKYLTALMLAILIFFILFIYQFTHKQVAVPQRATASPARLTDKPADHESEIADDFQTGTISETRWKVTMENDFRQSEIEVFDLGKGDRRLRLLADTIGTRDDTVKFLGVRSYESKDFGGGGVISFDLDWNNQSNGCYLSAGVYLSPRVTDTSPRNNPEWIAFEYVGVPPGENARFQVVKRYKGNLQFLFTEDWPEKQRAGRKIGNQHVEVILNKRALKVIENGAELFSTDNHGLNFTSGYIYLQMSSHSNYPVREIYFDNIRVSKGSWGERLR